jgi:hypothetical protein
VRATYVHGLGHYGRLDDMWVSNSVPGCGVRSLGVRGSLAARRAGVKKRFGCVTTRGCNVGIFNGLGHKVDSSTALLLCLSVLGFDISVLATFSLAPRRLPATNLPQALRLLTVALVPAPRLVRATTPLTQAVSDARSARSGPTAMISRTLASAHGRSCSQGKARGECVNILSEHHQNTNQSDAC